MQLLDDAVFSVSQLGEDSSGINWKSTVSSYFSWKVPSSYSFHAVPRLIITDHRLS